MSLRNFGNQLIGTSSVQFPPANNKAVCRFQNLSGAALTISKFYGAWGETSSGAKIKAVIYSDNAGSPDQLLATSNERIGIANTWNQLTFGTPLVIENNAYVWFGVISDTMLTSTKCTSGGTIKHNSNAYTSGPSATFGAASTAAFTYRMFLEGEDGTLSFGRRSIDDTGVAPGDGNYQPDREHCEKVTLGGSESVNVTSISTYITNTSASVKTKAAIYSDNSGYPGTKLAQTSEVTGSTANTWLELPIPGGVSVAPGTYWLAIITDTNLTTPVIPFSGALIVDGPMTEADAFPSTYPVGAPVVVLDPITDGRGIDIYASYTLAGGGSPSRPICFVCT